MRVELHFKSPVKVVLGLVVLFSLVLPAATAAPAPARHKAPADPVLSAALCQVVYPLDQSPEEGYRYMFLGNGFFIDNQGYVITAAHLLHYFRYGGEPYILVGSPESVRMVKAPIVAADWDHDVAILHATPNPFQGDSKITFLSLSPETPDPGSNVVADSLIPPDEKNAHTSVPAVEDFSQGEVVDYQFYSDRGHAQQQLLLFDQEVVPGQSGAPLVSAGSHAVVGVIVGRWLHPTVAPSGPQGGHVTVSPGAALRIHYAIGLLERLRVPWDMASETSAQPAATAQQTNESTMPVPLSLVGTPYPPQALFGGEVLLDAQVNSNGTLSDVRVASGDSPFVDAALGAVRTWTFEPARENGRAVESRIGIVFQFVQSFLPRLTQAEHKYDEPFAKSADRGALPVFTVEPSYPAGSIAEGSVIVGGLVDPDGQLSSVSIIRDVASLAGSAEDVMRQWQFAPALRNGEKTKSAVIVVTTFRRPASR